MNRCSFRGGACSIGLVVAVLHAVGGTDPNWTEPTVDELRVAIAQICISTNFAPRPAFALLERWAPRWPAESPAARNLAALLLEAIRNPETTPLGRIVLAQHLAIIGGSAERAELLRLRADPQLSEAVHLALGGDWPTWASRPAAAIETDLTAADPSVRLAALSELVHTDSHRALEACTAALVDSSDQVAASAIQWLARLDGARLIQRLDALPPKRQALALWALSEQRVSAAREAAHARLEADDPAVREAALATLGTVGMAEDVPALARIGAADAIAAIPDPCAEQAILRCLAEGSESQRVACVYALAARGASNLTTVLTPLISETNRAIRNAALKVLSRQGDVEVFERLLVHLRESPIPELEEALKHLAQRLADAPLPSSLVDLVNDAGAPFLARATALRILPAIGHHAALELIEDHLKASVPELRDAAIRALAQWRQPNAVPALLRVRTMSDASAAHRHLANEAIARLAPRLVHLTNVLAYLDCGPFQHVRGIEGVTLTVRRGNLWRWAETPAATVVHDPQEVQLEIGGLSPTGCYEIGLSWWDYDAGGREQSLLINDQLILPRTPLPRWHMAQQPEAVVRVPVPDSALQSRQPIRLSIRREAGPNAVVGEVWVCVNEERGPSCPPVAPTSCPRSQIEIRANTGAVARVLIVTGEDIHNWRETTPKLIDLLAQDPRLEIHVIEDPSVLAHELPYRYHIIVLHFQNHHSPLNLPSLERLRNLVNHGTGLVIVHFASGAFFDHTSKTVAPAYTQLAGRFWNPKLRPHDPRGLFTVRICDPAHPITFGLINFDTDDELYTCLDGDTPIHVLADAVSKVDGRPYPIVFVHEFGRGRVVHFTLGHDVRALSPPAVRTLLRRGTVWAAALSPVEP